MTAAEAEARVDGAPPRAKRPVAVTILAAIQIASGVLLILYSLGLGLHLSFLDVDIPGLSEEREDGAPGRALAVNFIVAGVFYVGAGIALLRLHRYGWTIAMLLAGISLAGQIVTFVATEEMVETAMLFAVVTTLYLNQTSVRTAFGITRARREAILEDERG